MHVADYLPNPRYPSKWWHAVQAHTFTALMSVLKTCTHDHEDRLTMLNLLSEDIDMNCDQVSGRVPVGAVVWRGWTVTLVGVCPSHQVQQLLDSDIMRESTEGLRVKQMARCVVAVTVRCCASFHPLMPPPPCPRPSSGSCVEWWTVTRCTRLSTRT